MNQENHRTWSGRRAVVLLCAMLIALEIMPIHMIHARAEEFSNNDAIELELESDYDVSAVDAGETKYFSFVPENDWGYTICVSLPEIVPKMDIEINVFDETGELFHTTDRTFLSGTGKFGSFEEHKTYYFSVRSNSGTAYSVVVIPGWQDSKGILMLPYYYIYGTYGKDTEVSFSEKNISDDTVLNYFWSWTDPKEVVDNSEGKTAMAFNITERQNVVCYAVTRRAYNTFGALYYLRPSGGAHSNAQGRNSDHPISASRGFCYTASRGIR